MYDPIDKNRIGQKLKDLRKEFGITAEELANAIGTTQSAIAMYEGGNRIPRDEIKIKIADYFGSNVETIFFATKSNEV